jgi:hypothetical protein
MVLERKHDFSPEKQDGISSLKNQSRWIRVAIDRIKWSIGKRVVGVERDLQQFRKFFCDANVEQPKCRRIFFAKNSVI